MEASLEQVDLFGQYYWAFGYQKPQEEEKEEVIITQNESLF